MIEFTLQGRSGWNSAYIHRNGSAKGGMSGMCSCSPSRYSICLTKERSYTKSFERYALGAVTLRDDTGCSPLPGCSLRHNQGHSGALSALALR